MSVVFYDGFDLGVPLTPKWTAVTLTNAFTVGGGRRTGTGALDLKTTGDSVSKTLATPTTDLIIAFAIKDYAEAVFLELYEGATKHLTFEFGASPNYYIKVKQGGGATLVTDTTANTANTEWQVFEIRAAIDDSAGTVTVRKNGAELFALTSQDTNNAGASGWVESFKLLGTHAGSTWYDDLYVIDTTDATAPTAFIGHTARVDTLLADGDLETSWTPSSGTTHYQMLDDVPADGDTTYVESSSLNARALCTLDALPYTPTTIYGVQANAVAKEDVSGSIEVAPAIKVGSTHYTGTAVAMDTTYARIAHLWTTNPASAVAWTKADVNALVQGAKLTAV